MVVTASLFHIIAWVVIIFVGLPQCHGRQHQIKERDAATPKPPVILPPRCPTRTPSASADPDADPTPRPKPTPFPQPHPTVAGSPSCACNNCYYGCWRQHQDYQKWGVWQTQNWRFLNSRRVRATNDHILEDGQAQFGEFPWMVAVFGPNNFFIGGGSLVAPRVVLTAGHTVHKSDKLIARIGDWDITSTYEYFPSQNISVKDILFQPDFNRSTLVNNIALLILQKDVVTGETVMPICLPDYQDFRQQFEDANCLVVGWEKNVFDKPGRYQSIMKKVSSTSISHSECQSMLQNTQLGPDFNLHGSFVCAGGLGERNFECEINGGSPLVCPSPYNPHVYVQVGVVSRSCGVVGSPSLFGSVQHAFDFIYNTINDNGGRICSWGGDLGRLLYSCNAWRDPGRVTGLSCKNDSDGVYGCKDVVRDSGCTCSTRCRVDFNETIYKDHC